MGKSKKRILNMGMNGAFPYMTREKALRFVVENITDKNKAIDKITLFGFTAEEVLEAGAAYEDVMALGGMIQ